VCRLLAAIDPITRPITTIALKMEPSTIAIIVSLDIAIEEEELEA